MTSFYEGMRQCYRKTKFWSEKDAQRKANKLKYNEGVRLYVYGCTSCGGYHLTKNAEVPSVL